MSTDFWIQVIGYVGSAIILVSFLMVSVAKLRIINSIGCFVSIVYGLLTHTYPTAIMNMSLLVINIFQLVRAFSEDSKDYDFVKTKLDDAMLQYGLKSYGDDIKKCFPGINMDFVAGDNCYIVCHQGMPAGFMIGRQSGDTLNILLDYSIPKYRDFSIGRFVFTKLPEDGIKKLIYAGNDENHKEYLQKTGYIKKDGFYEKNL